MMLKKKVDGLEDYYYQWMNKYKDDADRRGELLQRALLQLEIHAPKQVPLMDEIVEELADALGCPD